MAYRRLALIASALLVSACASNATTPVVASGNPQIEYRGSSPASRPVQVKPKQQASRPTEAAPVPPPRVVDMGAPSSSPAVVEAKAMQAETGMRPGGALVQPRD